MLQPPVHHSVLRHFPIVRFAVALVAIGINTDAAARSELAPHFDVFRFHQGNKIFHDDIYTILVKRAMVTETEQIQFQAFAFNHSFVRYVTNVYSSKIGLRGDGTKAGELRTIESYPVIIAGMRIFKSFEDCGIVTKFVFCFITKKHDELRIEN